MRPGLQLKINQQLTMTPQLQQAIRLLQLSTLELRQELIEQLYNNPLLELEEEEKREQSQDEQDLAPDESIFNIENNPVDAQALTEDLLNSSNSLLASETQDTPDLSWEDSGAADLPVEGNWEDVYNPVTSGIAGGSGEIDLEQVYQVTESLQDHLRWQLNLTPFSEHDKQIGMTLIDSVDNNGFLTDNVLNITEHLQTEDEPLPEEEIIAVLHRLQQFDPAGVFARDVQECLLIQINQLPSTTPYVAESRRLVLQFLNDLGSVDPIRLCKKTGYSLDQIRQAMLLIKNLNPRPGEALSSQNVDYIVPDAIVEKIDNSWRVRLNDANLPRLRINDSYSSLIKRSDDSQDNQYLKDNLSEARWFLRSLESRNETLMRVTMTIVELQKGFLEQGPIAMKPMVLADVANRLELHESTISRVTTTKYLATPQGIFELKYFFSSHVGTAGGGECSSTAVCAILKSMINAETPSKPLSDSKLTALLDEQGIRVARRTVAKYRESMGIASSSQRKRFENIIYVKILNTIIFIVSLLYGCMLNLTLTRYIFNEFIITRTIRVAYAAPMIP